MVAPLLDSVLANPGTLRLPYGIAEIDAKRQWGASKGQLPPPLLVSAIEHKGAHINIIRDFAQALDAVRVRSGNVANNGPWIQESPLVTAVRVGRVSVLNLLLKDYQDLLSWMRFEDEDTNPETLGRPPLYRHYLTAMHRAIEFFAAEQDPTLRHNIEECALTLIIFGTYLGPLKPEAQVAQDGKTTLPPRFVLTPSFLSAINSGMDRYTTAVVHRTLNLPPGNNHREALINDGLVEILVKAAQSGRHPTLIGLIVNQAFSTDGEILPFPSDSRTAWNANPIALALTSGASPRDAVQILQMLKTPLLHRAARRGVAPWEYIVRLLTNASIVTEAATGECLEYFVEHMNYIQTFLLGNRSLDPDLNTQVLEHCTNLVQLALLTGKSSLLNFFWAATHMTGFDTPRWLRQAILCGNSGAVQVIVARWIEQGQSLETLLPSVESISGIPGTETPQTALNDAVRVGHLSAVIILLNAGANPSSVDSDQWANLAKEVYDRYHDLSRFDFIKLYFSYGFFEWNAAVVSDEEMENNQAVEHCVKLIYQVAQQYSKREKPPSKK
ncbi:hypothetical protein F5Y00DRAFT_267511 [Daldinia vernicosa]|uniref:uncharacterized protein n=1 Tax=Daldinia vernicosa TaxID=114800 RepID=UPI00200805C7|nr:uncharacterized protein F5Y00DRAFT_267511 [Daldinia vernicosa]KAI0854302.1 hypothetical protein F5Y00DRAFT_267511 [Daldinia vernicosa]